ncbi:MAG: hypothetical protein U0521_22200 [Anaerolineae bacterium]
MVNLALWIACTWCVYLFVARLSKSRLAALTRCRLPADRPPRPGGDVLYRRAAVDDERAVRVCGDSVTSSAARSVEKRSQAGDLRPSAALAAVREYGLAFAGVVILFAFLSKNRDWKALTVVALLAVVAYGAIRLYSGVVSVEDYCDAMGFFHETRLICYQDLDVGGQLQRKRITPGRRSWGRFSLGCSAGSEPSSCRTARY